MNLEYHSSSARKGESIGGTEQKFGGFEITSEEWTYNSTDTLDKEHLIPQGWTQLKQDQLVVPLVTTDISDEEPVEDSKLDCRDEYEILDQDIFRVIGFISSEEDSKTVETRDIEINILLENSNNNILLSTFSTKESKPNEVWRITDSSKTKVYNAICGFAVVSDMYIATLFEYGTELLMSSMI